MEGSEDEGEGKRGQDKANEGKSRQVLVYLAHGHYFEVRQLQLKRPKAVAAKQALAVRNVARDVRGQEGGRRTLDLPTHIFDGTYLDDGVLNNIVQCPPVAA